MKDEVIINEGVMSLQRHVRNTSKILAEACDKMVDKSVDLVMKGKNSRSTGVSEGYVSISPDRSESLSQVITNLVEMLPSDVETVSFNDLHITLAYSEDTPPINLPSSLVGQSINLKVLGYDLLGEDRDHLVIRVSNDILDDIALLYKAMGEVNKTHPVFKPHITVAKGVGDLNMDIYNLPELPADIMFNVKSHKSEEAK